MWKSMYLFSFIEITDVVSKMVAASNQFCVLGVTLTSELSLDKHVANVVASCFYWFRQIWGVRVSLDEKSTATLVHAFVTSRVDYCNAILAGANKLQRVMSAATGIISNTRKYDIGLTGILHKPHWWDVPQWGQYKLCSTSIDVCISRHHSTWWTAASTPQTLLFGSTCGPLAVASCSYHDTGVWCLVVGPFLWLARRPGTRYQTIFRIRHFLLTVFVLIWKLFSRYTSVHSALEVLQLCAI